MNMTCAITRTPILSFQPVRVIFLRESVSETKHPSGFLHTTDSWAPISFPIPMSYEDYTDFYPRDEEGDWRIDRFLMELSEFWEEEYDDELTLEAVFRAVSKGELKLPDNHPMYRNHLHREDASVGLMAMHEKAYQLMVKSKYAPFMPGKKKTPTQMAEEIRAYCLQRAELKPFEQVTDPASKSADFWFASASSGGSVRVHGQTGPSPASIMGIITVSLQNGHDIDEPRFKDMIEAAAEMMIMQTNMDAMAIQYAPQMMASDDFSVDLMSEINEVGRRIYERDEMDEEPSSPTP
ncbi:hypothetical protein [Sulfitobacter sp. R18_1]|uniref:hypothetical protein n=1 Tax=Sulfitobacter sp. R18_1 TaxID=2821104 RepID=UPI001ADC8DDF|nr:hypothetical protein [Sulfitobacter sp. R18_1]MBO9428014.1 hypothetical protein [Sulfitobacter sp. R18_1]